jgi:hypothetical protein
MQSHADKYTISVQDPYVPSLFGVGDTPSPRHYVYLIKYSTTFYIIFNIILLYILVYNI